MKLLGRKDKRGDRTGTFWCRSSAVNSARPPAPARSVEMCRSGRQQGCLPAGGRADGNLRTFLCFRLEEEWVIPALWASDSTGELRVCLCEFQRAVEHFHADLCHCGPVQMCCNSALLFMAGFYTFFPTQISDSCLAESNEEKGWGGFYCSCGKFW